MEGARLRVAIVGSGNIGSDLLAKLRRSEAVDVVGMAGIDPDSAGLAYARAQGVTTTHEGLEHLLELEPGIELVFDATSASAHPQHAELLARRRIRSVDLTPSGLGPPVVPPVNLGDHLAAPDVNLITCGAQATVPIVAAVSDVGEVAYAETVSTIASRSAGPGTRQNIDEFTFATARSLETVARAARGKSIIILNPAEPPLVMRNTVYVEAPGIDRAEAEQAVRAAVDEVARYVPGYRLASDCQLRDGVLTVFVEVEGAGDHLPAYAGNLDIMTSAAVRVAELYAEAPTTA
jgi:acetaldehyde dehydrogenase